MEVGDRVDSRFLLRRRIGNGGMGQAFEANDLESGNVVVVKTILEGGLMATDAASRERAMSRFRREATILEQLGNNHIPKVYATRTLGHSPYIAMQFINGVSLREFLDGNPPASLSDVACLGTQVLEALNAVHQQGMVHRDLKPENIMIANSGWVYLIDFGIALPPGGTRYTMDFVGSARYMAPECLDRDPEKASDLYSLGWIFYEMLTGSLPFAPDSGPEMSDEQLITFRRERRDAPPVSMSDREPSIPPAVAELVDCLLAFEPGDRPEIQRICEVLESHCPHEGDPEPNPVRHPDLTLPIRAPEDVRPPEAAPGGRRVGAPGFKPGRLASRFRHDDVARRIREVQSLHDTGEKVADVGLLHTLLRDTTRIYGKRHPMVGKVEALINEHHAP